MRILFVHSPADLYGASRSLLRLCRDMRRSGLGVAVVLPEEGALSQHLAEMGVEIVLMPAIAKVERQNFTTAAGVVRFCRDVLSDIRALRRIIARWRPDVIHTNNSLIPSAAVAAKLAGRPHLWHLRETFREFPALWAVYKHIMGVFSTRIVCNSQLTADQLAGSWGARHARIVYNGLDRGEFCAFTAADVAAWRRRFSPEGGPVVGVVGRIRMVRKGQEVFVAAAQQLADAFPTARFVCIGDAYPGNVSHVEELRRRAERAGIGHRFEITGDIEDVAAATAALDIAVMPSVVPEAFGNVVMEAMCLGKPVVASANGGGREQIEEGVTGFLVPAGDADALARALATLLADPERARAMGEAGRRRFEALFTSDKGHAAIRRLYAEIGLDTGPSSPSRMRILFVHSPADLYGASRALLRLCSDMRRSGMAVAVVLPEEGALSQHLAEMGVEIVLMPGIAKVERQNFTTAAGVVRFCRDVLSDIRAQRRIIAQWRPDVIHTNNSLIPSAAVAAKLARRPHLWHLRETFSEFPALWAVYKHVMGALSTRIVCCSQLAADQFAGSWGGRRTRIVYEGLARSEFCAFSAADVATWRRRFAPEGGPVVGVVGRIRMVRKGQEVFVAAAQQLADAFPTARFVCIGDAYPGNVSHVEELRRRAERAGIGHRFEITGDIEDVAAATAALDIAVMPSVVPEAFGNVVMEAMCLGIPMVASSNGGGREQIEEGVTGFLVPAGDADALARALATLLADPERARAMGEAGRRRFEALFTSDKGHAAIRRLYAELGFDVAPEC